MKRLLFITSLFAFSVTFSQCVSGDCEIGYGYLSLTKQSKIGSCGSTVDLAEEDAVDSVKARVNVSV